MNAVTKPAALAGCEAPTETTTTAAASAASATTATPKETPVKPNERKVTAEDKAALAKAEFYATNMDMSKAGVRQQLTAAAGEAFPAAAADYAIANLDADWNNNALTKAKFYRDNMNMSTAAIREQLTSKHGEAFTPAEADYAIDHLKG